MDFYALVWDYTRPCITFYMDEIYHSLGSSCKHPTIHIMAYINNKGVKWVKIDKGSMINVVSTMMFHHLNTPLSFLSMPTLAIRAFNNTLSSTLGVFVLPLRVGARSITIAYHVMEGDMQYNILLGFPWIDQMEGIFSSKHGCFKYLHEGKMHCIPIDANPFSHYNLIQTNGPFSMPSLLPMTILVNNNPN